MYINTDFGQVFIHSEPWDEFLRLVCRSNGKVKQYRETEFWRRDNYKGAEEWLRWHAENCGYEIVEEDDRGE